MAKELYLLRHAKSDWNGYYTTDFERGLNKRGKHDAPLIGSVLHKKDLHPDLLISSSANRAQITAKIIADHIGYAQEKIRYEERIYEASKQTLLDVIASIPADVEKLMLVGHNPGLTTLINMLTTQHLSNLPTCGIVGISFDITSWEDISTTVGKVLFFEYPKKYR